MTSVADSTAGQRLVSVAVFDGQNASREAESRRRAAALRDGLSQKSYYGCGTEIRTDDGARCTKGSPRRQRRTRSSRGYC